MYGGCVADIGSCLGVSCAATGYVSPGQKAAFEAGGATGGVGLGGESGLGQLRAFSGRLAGIGALRVDAAFLCSAEPEVDGL